MEDAAEPVDARVRAATRTAFGGLAVVVLQIPTWTLALVWVIGEQGIYSEGPARVLAASLAGVAVSVVLAVLAVVLIRMRIAETARWRAAVIWSGTVLAAAMIVLMGPNLNIAIVVITWWAIVSTVPPRIHAVLAAAVLTVLPWVLYALFFRAELHWGQMVVLYVFAAVFAVILRLVNVAMMGMWELARDAVSGREAQARLAVSEERLRFARDLHDLLGHSLSGMAVKSELAARLARADPGRAEEEMGQVRTSARRALREMRAAVSGYRDVDLDSQIADVCGVLRAAGAGCTVTGGAQDVPEELHPLLAWVVREGGTNVVRHSAAKRCAVVLRREERQVVVEVRNDGAPRAETRADAVVPGNGITGLTERVAAAGGSLTAARSGEDAFVLRAVLPVGDGSEPGRGPDPGGHGGGRTDRGRQARSCEAAGDKG